MKTHFSYDPEDGFDFHATAEEAKAAAGKALDVEREHCLDDGWGETVDAICWGKVEQVATQVNLVKKEDGCTCDKDPEECEWYDHVYDWLCGYDLLAPGEKGRDVMYREETIVIESAEELVRLARTKDKNDTGPCLRLRGRTIVFDNDFSDVSIQDEQGRSSIALGNKDTSIEASDVIAALTKAAGFKVHIT